MINLRSTHSDSLLEHIGLEWYRDVLTFLSEKRLGNIKAVVLNTSLSETNRLLADDVINDFTNKPQSYILAGKERIEEIRLSLETSWKFMVPMFHDIFTKWYTDFASQYGEKYMDALNIRTCPYCNRSYTFTIKRTSYQHFKTRPEFDHFYDKKKYPLLALSFYNLVPSCHTCNHIKSTKKAGVNPYFDGFHSSFSMMNTKTFRKMNVNEALHIQKECNFEIDIPSASVGEKQNIETFGINQLYNGHKDYVMEIIDKANAYNAVGAQNLIEAFQGIDHSPKDVFDFVWGRNLEKSDFLNRPLSKLTHDILQQLGIDKY